MNEIFEMTARPAPEVFFKGRHRDDQRLGEIVSSAVEDYLNSDIVILGYPCEQGILKGGGRAGAALGPNAIREEFYKLTPFGIHQKIFDLGDTRPLETLEKTHETQKGIVERILSDGKRLIVLGGGGDISYADGAAMAKVFGGERWIGINVDSQFDVRQSSASTNQTQYRRLLDEKLLLPQYFYEIAFQPYFCSPNDYRYLLDQNAKLISLEQLRSRETADTELRELIRQEFIHHTRTMNVFFGFDMQAVRASDAPGVGEPSPFGLRAGEFLKLVEFAAQLVNTKMIEFTEVNPNFDYAHRTAKLVAIAMHKFSKGEK